MMARRAELDALTVLLEQLPGALVVSVKTADGNRVAKVRLPALTGEPDLCIAAFPPRELTPCERDILGVIETAGKRLTTSQVLHALDEAGMVHGESTVRTGLPRLKNEIRLLTNGTDERGKGYGLVEWGDPCCAP